MPVSNHFSPRARRCRRACKNSELEKDQRSLPVNSERRKSAVADICGLRPLRRVGLRSQELSAIRGARPITDHAVRSQHQKPLGRAMARRCTFSLDRFAIAWQKRNVFARFSAATAAYEGKRRGEGGIRTFEKNLFFPPGCGLTHCAKHGRSDGKKLSRICLEIVLFCALTGSGQRESNPYSYEGKENPVNKMLTT